MRPDHRKEAEEILQALLNHTPEDRGSFVSQACAGDPAPISDIDTLLSQHETSENVQQLHQPETDLNSCNHLGAEEHVDPLIGRRLGAYRIEREVARGGMGTVYEALRVDNEFTKRVAIKVIRQNYANQKVFIDNFIGEAKLVADLIHTNIVQTYHLGQVGGQYFMVMEFVAGQVAPYKKVRQVEFIEAIPKSASGKILRKDLRTT